MGEYDVKPNEDGNEPHLPKLPGTPLQVLEKGDGRYVRFTDDSGAWVEGNTVELSETL